MHALAYLRISRDAEESTSIERQRADIEAYCAARGIEISEWFSDVGKSAWKKGAKRSGYDAMLAAAQRGGVDLVVVWRLDRLSRSLLDFVRTASLLEDAGVGLVLTAQDFDTSGPMGRMVLRIVATFAEFESETISARTRSMHDHRVKSGTPMWSRRVFGWRKDRTLEPTEAPHLREIVDAVLEEGISYYEAARRLNGKGVRTSSGAPWCAQTMRRVLRNPRLVGWADDRGDLLRGKDGQPLVVGEALIDELTWRRLQRILEERKGFRPEGEGSMLSGIATCALCGKKLRKTGDERWSYFCAGRATRTCEGVHISGRQLDAEIVRRARAEVEGQAWKAAAPDDGEMELLHSRRRRLVEALELLSHDHYTEQLIPREEYRRRRRELEADLGVVDEAIVERDVPSVDPYELTRVFALWSDLTVPEQRSVLRTLIEDIKVSRAVPPHNSRRAIDWETRIDVRWAHRDDRFGL